MKVTRKLDSRDVAAGVVILATVALVASGAVGFFAGAGILALCIAFIAPGTILELED